MSQQRAITLTYTDHENRYVTETFPNQPIFISLNPFKNNATPVFSSDLNDSQTPHVAISWQDNRPSVKNLTPNYPLFVNGMAIANSSVSLEENFTLSLRDSKEIQVHWTLDSDSKATAKLSKTLAFPLSFSPEFLDKFRSYIKIGAGSYGEVWKAKNLQNKTWYAIKVISLALDNLEISQAEMEERESTIRRVQREANLLMETDLRNCPHIVKTLELGSIPDIQLFYMIMEYIEGETLQDKIDREKFIPQSDVCQYLFSMAEGIKFAHNLEWIDTDGKNRKSIIHRDLRPPNILIRKSDNQALICDFGVAAIGNSSSRLTKLPHNVTHEHYSPPEGLMSDTVNTSLDVWAFSVTAYNAFSGGRMPFSNIKSRTELVKKIRNGRFTRINTYQKNIPENINSAFEKAFAYDKKKRLSLDEWQAILDPKLFLI